MQRKDLKRPRGEGADDGLDAAYAEEVVIKKISDMIDTDAPESLSRLQHELKTAVEVILINRRANAAAGIVLPLGDEANKLRWCTVILKHATMQWERVKTNADSLKQIITDMSEFAKNVKQSYIQLRSDTNKALVDEHENARVFSDAFIKHEVHEVLFEFLPKYQWCLQKLADLKKHKQHRKTEIERLHKLNTQLFNNAYFVRELIREMCTAPIIATNFASTQFEAVRPYTAAASDFDFVVRTAAADYETELHDHGINACIETCEKIKKEMQKIFQPIITLQTARTAGGRRKKEL